MSPSPWSFYVQVKGSTLHMTDDAVLDCRVELWRTQSGSTLLGIEKQFFGIPAHSVAPVPTEQETQ